MALWGKGDARWIVEEREDAKNVNNWHWSEVDASTPSKKFFKEKFMALTATGTEGSVRVSEVSILLFYLFQGSIQASFYTRFNNLLTNL